MESIAIAGTVGKIRELRATPKGTPVIDFSVAVRRGRDETGWYECSAFGQRAEFVAKHVVVGEFVAVSGRPSCRAYTRKDGELAAEIKIMVDGVSIAWKKADEQQRSEAKAAAPRAPAPQPQAQAGTLALGEQHSTTRWTDDEIPF